MKNKNAECIKTIRIHAFSVLILLLMMAGCDSITSPGSSDQNNNTGMQNPYFSGSGDDLNTAGSLSSVSGSYTITLLPEGVVDRHNAFLVVDEIGGVFGSVRHATGMNRAAKWTADASGNVTGPILLGTLPPPYDQADQYVKFTSGNGDLVLGSAGNQPDPTAGWVWANGTMTRLQPVVAEGRVIPMAVNDAGVIVGQINLVDGTGDWGAVWLPPYNADPILLPRMEGYGLNTARGITNEGVISGGVRDFDGDKADALIQWRIDSEGNVVSGPDMLEGIDHVLLSDANQDLDVVGAFHGNGYFEAFLFRSTAGQRIDLAAIEGHSWNGARSVTNRSQNGTVQIAGYSRPGQMQHSESRAVVWSVDGSNGVTGPLDIGLPADMVISVSPHHTIGFIAASAFSINSQGWVVGLSQREDGQYFSTLWQWNPDEGDDPSPPGEGPTASFDYACGRSSTCQFKDTSTEGGAAIVLREWVTGNQSASGSPVSFTFGAEGDHIVSLSVADAGNGSDQTSKTVTCKNHRVQGLRCS